MSGRTAGLLLPSQLQGPKQYEYLCGGVPPNRPMPQDFPALLEMGISQEYKFPIAARAVRHSATVDPAASAGSRRRLLGPASCRPVPTSPG